MSLFKAFQNKYREVRGLCQNCGKFIGNPTVDFFPHFKGKRISTKLEKQTGFTFVHREVHDYQNKRSNNLKRLPKPDEPDHPVNDGSKCLLLFLEKFSSMGRDPKPFWRPFVEAQRGVW